MRRRLFQQLKRLVSVAAAPLQIVVKIAQHPPPRRQRQLRRDFNDDGALRLLAEQFVAEREQSVEFLRIGIARKGLKIGRENLPRRLQVSRCHISGEFALRILP